MNRRRFGTLSLAAAVTAMPRWPVAQQTEQTATGYQMAALNDGLLSLQHGGMARAGVRVTDATLFQVASCSKTVTTLTVLTLVRDGRLTLDTPVNRYLSRWQLPGRRGDTATIAELMSHTAGTNVHGFAGYGPSDELPDVIEILRGQPPANSEAVRARPRLFGQFRYSGGGTTVLQALIEDVTGETFANYTTRAVLRPVGASAATFAITPLAAFAHGYHDSGQLVAGGYRRHPESSAAGLWAAAADLVKLFEAVLFSLQRKPRALLPFELASRMVTPVSQQSGLGVFVEPGRVIWHEGRNYGFDSIVAAELTSGRIRAALTNRNRAIESYARGQLPQ